MPVPPKRYIEPPLRLPQPPTRFRFNPDSWLRDADPTHATIGELIDTLEARLDAHQERESLR